MNNSPAHLDIGHAAEPTRLPVLGPNAGRPEHHPAGLADARAYHDRLAARGERDES